MCKIIEFAVVVILQLVVLFRVQVQGCKLYCLACPSESPPKRVAKYYCCMQDWETKPSPRNCAYGSGSSTTTSSTASSATSSSTSSASLPPAFACPPCTTLATMTPPPNRCPALGSPSISDCAAYRRIHPNPTTCNTDTDCTAPFNVCCDDSCFSTKICKTYRASFGR